jgi:hypothetical protein
MENERHIRNLSALALLPGPWWKAAVAALTAGMAAVLPWEFRDRARSRACSEPSRRAAPVCRGPAHRGKARTFAGATDKHSVSRFLDDARAIFETAESASRSGQSVSDFTMLIGHDGSIHVIASTDWPLDRLLSERGARAVYRIAGSNGRIELEARSASQTCKLESESPAARARRLPGFRLPIAPLPARTLLLPPVARG